MALIFGLKKMQKIYTTKVNKERYEETAQDYDVIDAYYKFLDVSKDFANITYLEENDEFEMIGLHVEVLHAWDEFVDRQPLHSCNFGSLMFKLEGKKQSILYCSDNGDDGKGCGPMEQDILSDQKDNLDADYVQLGHHGNWGFTETTFIDDLGADSLDVFQIIMGLEEEFDIEIANEDAEKIVTVGDALEQINIYGKSAASEIEDVFRETVELKAYRSLYK